MITIAFFDTALVCNLGLGAQILGTVFWAGLLAVGQSTARKATALACLVLAGLGIYAANSVCMQKASANLNVEPKSVISYSGLRNTAAKGGRVSSRE